MKNDDSFFRESSMVWTPWLEVSVYMRIITASYYLKELSTSSGLRDYFVTRSRLFCYYSRLKNTRTLRVICMCFEFEIFQSNELLFIGGGTVWFRGILVISHGKYPRYLSIKFMVMCSFLNHEFTS